MQVPAVGHGGVWSKVGKGDVARTVRPFDHGDLTPNHFYPSGLSVFYFVPAAEHLLGTVLAQKMLWFVCHSCWSLGFTHLPSSGQGENTDIPTPTGPRKQESVSEVSMSAAQFSEAPGSFPPL